MPSLDCFPATISIAVPEMLEINTKDIDDPKKIKDILKNIHQSYLIIDSPNESKSVLSSSHGFYNLTGYSPSEIVGENLSFLHGCGTCTDSIQQLDNALINETSISTNIVSYKKDGTPFWNTIHVIPKCNTVGSTEYFIAFQTEISNELSILMS